MTYSNASLVIMVALGSSSSALAQPFAPPGSPPVAPVTEPSRLEVPPGYASPMPRTRAEWEDMRS
jgi:hypothetical protein